MRTESEEDFEDDAMGWLEPIGWDSHRTEDEYGGTKLDRETGRNKTDVIHYRRLRNAVIRNNSIVTESNVETVINQVEDELKTQAELIESNKKFFENVIARGIDVQIPTDNGQKNTTIQLIDLENSDNNTYDAVSQHEYGESRGIRPDIVLFINGIPIVPLELKDITRGKTVSTAISDMKGYEEGHEKFFYPVLMNVVATQSKLRYAAVGASKTYYNPWKPEDIDPESSYGRTGYDVKKCFKSLLKPERLLDFIKNYVFYDTTGPDSAKIVPRHHQYFAVERIFDRVDKTEEDNIGSARGLVWHTQGSGKSYAMYLAARIATRRRGSKAILLVDKVNLKKQMKKELNRLEPGFDVTVSQTQDQLIDDIGGSSDIVLTNIHLFDDIRESIKPDKDTYVFVDESHRFMEKDLGTHLDAALPTDTEPSVHHFGFTGTPVSSEQGNSSENRDTFNNYSMSKYDTESPYLHRYSMKTGVEEGTIVKVDMVRRVLDHQMDNEAMDEEFLSNFNNQEEINEAKKMLDQGVSIRQVTSTDVHAEAIADDVQQYYDTNVRGRKYANKSMVITSSREAAARIGGKLVDRYDDDMVKVLYTSTDHDGELLQRFHTTEGEREDIQDEYIDEEDPKILVVCSMLLTGFDAPILGAIFLDRKLADHNLMQAIARANRPNGGKKYGEIVDYCGATKNIENMYEDLDEDVTLYVSRNKEEFIEQFDQQVEDLVEYFPEEDRDPSYNANHIYGQRKHKEFQEEFKRLRDLMDGIKPDKRMIQREDDFKSLEQVYMAISAIESEDPNESTVNRQEVEESAKESMEKHMKVTVSKGDENQVTVDRWMPENMGVRKKQKEMQTIVKERSKQSPAFKDLSERVEEIIRRWHDGQSTEDTKEQLREVEDELNQRTTPDELDERQWLRKVVRDVVIEVLVREEVDNNIDRDEISDNVVDSVVETFVDGWHETRNISDDERRHNEVSLKVKETMAKSKDQYDELLDSNFASTVTEYLANNMK